MSIDSELSTDKKSLTITIDGDFDSSIAEEFKQAYEAHDEPLELFILNMHTIHYMDSTALGLLLVMREYAENNGIDIHIVNMNDVVLEIFRVLNFHKLFKPEYNRETYKVDWVAHFRN